MNDFLGEGLVLCGDAQCGWYDYSVPGNILYGFAAASVGVPLHYSLLAGGALEIKEGTAQLDNFYTLFEDPHDFAAVSFGYYLYGKYVVTTYQ